MPATHVMTRSDRFADLACHFESECKRGEHLSARSRVDFRDRERRRHHRRTWMTTQCGNAVVEVERMRAHAVRKSGFGGRRAGVLAPESRLRLCARLTDPAQCEFADRLEA